MDEVDGMGGSDRGGIAELIKVIKMSKIPIICICNDRQSQKIRSLVNHCYDLRVKRPTKQQIGQRMVAVAAQEGLRLDPNAAEVLVEQSGNDIRQALNALQMWRASSTTMSYSDIKGGGGGGGSSSGGGKEGIQRIEKDKVLRQTPFDACGSILGGNKTSFDDRYNAFFIDYSLTPLLIQQNYIDSAKSGIFRNPLLDDVARMEQLAQASDAVSDSDLAAAAIRGQNMHWELLTTQAMFCVRAGACVQGFQAFPTFPAWLGKQSTQSKLRRLTNELVHHTALSVGQGFQAVRLDYVPYLRQALLQRVGQVQATAATAAAAGTPADVVELLDAYGLTREDFMENMKELQLCLEGDKELKDLYDSIDTKTKTALTKAYNSASHTSQVLVGEILASKAAGGKKGKKAASADLDPLDVGEEAREEMALLATGNGEEEEEDEKVDLAAFASKKKKSAATKASSSSSKGSKKK